MLKREDTFVYRKKGGTTAESHLTKGKLIEQRLSTFSSPFFGVKFDYGFSQGCSCCHFGGLGKRTTEENACTRTPLQEADRPRRRIIIRNRTTNIITWRCVCVCEYCISWLEVGAGGIKDDLFQKTGDRFKGKEGNYLLAFCNPGVKTDGKKQKRNSPIRIFIFSRPVTLNQYFLMDLSTVPNAMKVLANSVFIMSFVRSSDSTVHWYLLKVFSATG